MTRGVAESYPLQSTRHHSGRAYSDLTDWLAHLKYKGRSARTLDDYERTVAALIEWDDKDPAEYTVTDLERFTIERFGTGPGAGTRTTHLRSFFAYLFRHDRIPKNPALLLETPKRPGQKVIDVFTDAELALIYATDSLAALMCETGIRKSEARKLQRRHVDLQRGDLVVYEGKGRKDRVVPLTVRAMQIVADLDILEGLKPDDHLWATRPGGGNVVKRRDPISDTAMQRWWAHPEQGVLARAGVAYRNMHVTRHTFATRLIRRGARIENVKQLMGHTSIQTTVDLYGHLGVEDARADLALLTEIELTS